MKSTNLSDKCVEVEYGEDREASVLELVDLLGEKI